MSATLTELRAVRIACDVFLKDELLKQIKHLGPSGYTWWEAQGTCPPQADCGFVGELPRVIIEVWCSLEVAEKSCPTAIRATFQASASLQASRRFWFRKRERLSWCPIKHAPSIYLVFEIADSRVDMVAIARSTP